MRLVTTATIAALLTTSLPVPLVAQSADPRNLPPPGSWSGGDAFAGTLRCFTYGNAPRSCGVDTQNRVVLLQAERGQCREGRDWGYDHRRIWVDNGCTATFGYGYAVANRPIPPGNWQDRNFAGTLECRARGRQQERCYVDTQNRVELLDASNRACVAGSSWGYTRDFIWVSNRCSAFFGYGNAYYQPEPERKKGSNAGLIIGGVVVAAGLAALLAGRKKPKADAGSEQTYKPQPPAAIAADLSALPAAARPSVQTCLFEAARQVGATGATRLRYDATKSITQGNGGWRLSAAVTSTYPDGDKASTMICRATPKQVIALDFS